MSERVLSGETIVVIDRAMVSSLGSDSVTACAAARAGVTRARELVMQIDGADTSEGDSPVVGHAADTVARGFDGQGRLLRLVSVALRELAGRGTVESGTNLYLAVPNPERVAQSLGLVASDEERGRIEVGLHPTEKKPASLESIQRFVAEATRVSAFAAELRLVRVFGSDHTAMLEALNEAVADLRAGPIRSAVVGGVDSYVTSRALAWLKSTGRLRTEENTVGLLPGEAACFLVLERWDEALIRGHDRVLGSIGSVAITTAQHSLVERSPSDGRALAKAILEAAAANGKAPAAVPWFIADLNGEEYRAREWGDALVHLPPSWAQAHSAIPALNHGETGAASAGVGILTALHAFSRGCAPSSSAIVSSCSDGRLRAAALINDFSSYGGHLHG